MRKNALIFGICQWDIAKEKDNKKYCKYLKQNDKIEI